MRFSGLGSIHMNWVDLEMCKLHNKLVESVEKRMSEKKMADKELKKAVDRMGFAEDTIKSIRYIVSYLGCTVDEAINYYLFEKKEYKKTLLPPDSTSKKSDWIVDSNDVILWWRLNDKFSKCNFPSGKIPITKEEEEFLNKYPGIIKEL